MTDTGREVPHLGANGTKAGTLASNATGDARAFAFVARAVGSALRNMTSTPGSFSLNDVFTSFKIGGRSYHTAIMSQVMDDLIDMGMASKRGNLYKVFLTSAEGVSVASCDPLMGVLVTRGLQRLHSKPPDALPIEMTLRARDWMVSGNSKKEALVEIASLAHKEASPRGPSGATAPDAATAPSSDRGLRLMRTVLQNANPCWNRMDISVEDDRFIVAVPIVSPSMDGWEASLRVTVKDGSCVGFTWGDIPSMDGARPMLEEVDRMKSRVVDKISRSSVVRAMGAPPAGPGSGTAPIAVDAAPASEPVKDEQEREGSRERAPEPVMKEVDDPAPEPAPASVQPWESALTEEQRQRLDAAQEAVLRLMHDKALSRKEIFAGFPPGPWQDTFCVRLEAAGIVRRTGERFQTRWVIPDDVQNLPSVDKLIALVLDEQEYTDYLFRVHGKPQDPARTEAHHEEGTDPKASAHAGSEGPSAVDVSLEERVLMLEDSLVESHKVNLEVVQQLNAVILKWKSLEDRVKKLESASSRP
jgi:hypothetical protein